MVAVQKINCRIYNLLARPAYFLSVALTVAVYFIGATTNGAARWIPLGPFQFQPSEALKVATVLFLARQLAGRQSKIDKIRIVPTWKFWTWRSSPVQRKIWREGTWPILMPVVVSALVTKKEITTSSRLIAAESATAIKDTRMTQRAWLGVFSVFFCFRSSSFSKAFFSTVIS